MWNLGRNVIFFPQKSCWDVLAGFGKEQRFSLQESKIHDDDSCLYLGGDYGLARKSTPIITVRIQQGGVIYALNNLTKVKW